MTSLAEELKRAQYNLRHAKGPARSKWQTEVTRLKTALRTPVPVTVAAPPPAQPVSAHPPKRSPHQVGLPKNLRVTFGPRIDERRLRPHDVPIEVLPGENLLGPWTRTKTAYPRTSR